MSGVIDPSAIPIPKADPDAVEDAGRALKKDGNAIAQTGDDIHSDWQGLDEFYTAPHEAQLFAATKPIADAGHDFDGEVTTVGNALIAFAGEIRPLISRLQTLKGDAQQFRSDIAGDDDWRENEDKVNEHNQLNDDILAAIVAYQAAERECANKITGIFGGTHFVPVEGDPGKGEYGLADAPSGVETPWAKPQEYDAPWYEDVGNAFKDFGMGIVNGLGDLVGLHGQNGWVWEEDSHWLDNLGDNWMGMLEGTAGLVGLWGPNGWVWEGDSDWTDNITGNWKALAHAMVPWNEWGDRPGYVITSSILNIGSIFAGGAGAVKGIIKGTKKIKGRGDGDDSDAGSGDRNGDGRLDSDEIGFGENPTTQQLQNQLDNLDLDTDELADSLDDMEDLADADREPAHVGGNENGNDQPDDTDGPTGGGDNGPLDNDQTPMPDGDGTPDNDGTTPDGDGTTPDGDTGRPDGDGTTPDTDGTTPDNDGTTSDGDSTKPDGDGTTPDTDGTTPDGDGTTPDGDGATPDGDGTSPDGDGTTPEGDGATPEGDGSTPDGDGTTPEGDGYDVPEDHFGDQDLTQEGPVGDKFRPGVLDPESEKDIHRFDEKERSTAEARADEGRLVTRLPLHPQFDQGYKSMDALERSGPDDPGTPTEYKEVGKDTRRAFDHQLKNGFDKFEEQPDGSRLHGDVIIDGRRAGLSEENVIGGLKGRLTRMLGADDPRLAQLGKMEIWLGDGSKIVYQDGRISKIDADGEHTLNVWDPDSGRFTTPDADGPRGDGNDGDEGDDGDGGTPRTGTDPPTGPRDGGDAETPDAEGPDTTPVGDGAGDSGDGNPPPGDANADGSGRQGPGQDGPDTSDPTPNDPDGGSDPDGSTSDGADSDGTTKDPLEDGFDSNEAGEEYGETRLGHQYNELPEPQANAVREYTRHSWPYNGVLRGMENLQDNLHKWWNNVGWGWHVFEMNGGRPPSLDDIYNAAGRSDLTPEQRQIVDGIINSPDPENTLESVIQHSGARGWMARTFDGFPTVEDFKERVRLIDEALGQPLPEAVTTQRGLANVNFMDGFNGDMRSLIGTTQTDEAFMSTALGKTPPPIDGREHDIIMHMKVPEGSHGLWMGSKSIYSEQRELILPRNTKYEITDVREVDGKWHIIANVLETPVNHGL